MVGEVEEDASVAFNARVREVLSAFVRFPTGCSAPHQRLTVLTVEVRVYV